MKLYILKHPLNGYLTSNKWYYGSWSEDINKAKKWSSISHVKSLMKQTTRPDRLECKIIMLEFNQEPNITELN